MNTFIPATSTSNHAFRIDSLTACCCDWSLYTTDSAAPMGMFSERNQLAGTLYHRMPDRSHRCVVVVTIDRTQQQVPPIRLPYHPGAVRKSGVRYPVTKAIALCLSISTTAPTSSTTMATSSKHRLQRRHRSRTR